MPHVISVRAAHIRPREVDAAGVDRAAEHGDAGWDGGWGGRGPGREHGYAHGVSGEVGLGSAKGVEEEVCGGGACGYAAGVENGRWVRVVGASACGVEVVFPFLGCAVGVEADAP